MANYLRGDLVSCFLAQIRDKISSFTDVSCAGMLCRPIRYSTLLAVLHQGKVTRS